MEEAGMPESHQNFWSHSSYAVVGHSQASGFPKLTYQALKKQDKQVFAVDASVAEIDGDETVPDLASLPQAVEAVVLEVPKEETADWMTQAADAGITNVWIHMKRDTPEALAVGRERGLDVVTGTCAVMYLDEGFSAHGLHRWINKMIGRY
jgi:predicted CoA-binding protein